MFRKSMHLLIFLIIVILKSFVKIGNCEIFRKFNRKERKDFQKEADICFMGQLLMLL